MEDKVVVTNRTALTAKYGPKGFTAVRAAVAALVARDKTRDIKTAVVYLDDATQMKKLGAKPLARVSDYRGAKAAIDGVFKALKPDWLMILGASDVVPHQDLDNPAFKAGDDDDEQAWGDLPYACDVGYGRDPAKFVGPTRVVTRLPDLTGANEPSHLVKLLKTATNWKGRKASEYTNYFGLSASVWKGSTALSLDNIFGNTTALMLAPPSGPKYPGGKLGARMHFINCHHGETSARVLWPEREQLSCVAEHESDTRRDQRRRGGGDRVLLRRATLRLGHAQLGPTHLPELSAPGRLWLSRQHDDRLRPGRWKRLRRLDLSVFPSEYPGWRIGGKRRADGASAISCSVVRRWIRWT